MYAYEIRTASGAICCGGDQPDFPRCPKCIGVTPTHTTSLKSLAEYAPPAPYTAALKALSDRIDMTGPKGRGHVERVGDKFVATYTLEGATYDLTREFDTRAEAVAFVREQVGILKTAQSLSFDINGIPDPYAAGLAAMRESR